MNSVNVTPGQPTQAAIPAAVEKLDKATSNVHDVITTLEQRLASVLAPQPPQGVSDPQAKLARHSLALQIESATASVDGAASRLMNILSRLEL